MGYVLSPDEGLPEGFGAEVRRESFYIYPLRDDIPKDQHKRVFSYKGYPGEDCGNDTVEFELKDIPALRQILDAVEAHR